LALAAAGCARREPPWNVLLVTFDTTRADRIGCYGNDRVSTPTLDALAADGVRFARTLSAVPITAPSHSTILTGRYPVAHGVRDNGLFVLGDEQVTLAEILRDHGYATAAAVGAFPVTSQFGLDQGFDVFDDHLTGRYEDYLGRRAAPKENLFFDERRAAQVNEAVLPWIDEHAADPFFVWVHYFDPHQPFEPPPPYDQLYADDPYNGEIAYSDSRLGFLIDHLRRLGVLDRTLVVMSADHGEGLGEHNEDTHAVLAYNSTLHVPLIVRPPSGTAPPGRVIEDWAGTVDILPTVLDLLGIDRPEGLHGRSLVPLWRDGAAAASDRKHYAENLSPSLTHGWGELRVLIDGSTKYVHGPRPELFDLEVDPHELRNLLTEQPDTVRRMRQTLKGFIESHAVAGSSVVVDLDEETRRRLESLGYLHSGGNAEREIVETLRDDGIAPQERVGDINDLSAAKHLLFAGRAAEALVFTERLVADNPGSSLYLGLHASALTELGRLDEAWEVTESLRGIGAVSESLVLRLAARHFESGAHRAAVDGLARYLGSKPTARAAWLLASLHQRLGEPQRALAALGQAIALEPGFVPARIDLAVRSAEAGDAEAAEEMFLEVLKDAPYHAPGFYNYGTFLLKDGRFGEAEIAFRRAIALAPRYLRAHLALVAALLVEEDRAQAEAAYEELRRLAPTSQESVTAAELLAEPQV
jgi:arylsulfatase A-like enzyme/Tfp pilus assembly protein PilF